MVDRVVVNGVDAVAEALATGQAQVAADIVASLQRHLRAQVQRSKDLRPWLTSEYAACKLAYETIGFEAAKTAASTRTASSICKRARRHNWKRADPGPSERIVDWAKRLPENTPFTNAQVFEISNTSETVTNKTLARLVEKGLLKKTPWPGHTPRNRFTYIGEQDESKNPTP